MIQGALLGRELVVMLPSHFLSVEIGCCYVAKVHYQLSSSHLGLLSAGLSTFDGSQSRTPVRWCHGIPLSVAELSSQS